MFTPRKLDEFGEKTPKESGKFLHIKGEDEELSECSKLIVPQEILPGEVSINRILIKCKENENVDIGLSIYFICP